MSNWLSLLRAFEAVNKKITESTPAVSAAEAEIRSIHPSQVMRHVMPASIIIEHSINILDAIKIFLEHDVLFVETKPDQLLIMMRQSAEKASHVSQQDFQIAKSVFFAFNNATANVELQKSQADANAACLEQTAQLVKICSRLLHTMGIIAETILKLCEIHEATFTVRVSAINTKYVLKKAVLDALVLQKQLLKARVELALFHEKISLVQHPDIVGAKATTSSALEKVIQFNEMVLNFFHNATSKGLMVGFKSDPLDLAISSTPDFLARNHLSLPFPTMLLSRVIWLHVGNETTSNIVTQWKSRAGATCVIEINSIEELDNYLKLPHRRIHLIVTEMGFWSDKNHTAFDPEAGIKVLTLFSHKPHLYHDVPKYVISARVRENVNDLRTRCTQLGAEYTGVLDPLYTSLPLPKTRRENELQQCINVIREGFEKKPIVKPVGSGEYYPTRHFNIEHIYDIENPHNIRTFLQTCNELRERGLPAEYEWLFHASTTIKDTCAIANENFLVSKLGSAHGNMGVFGNGIYFGTRAYISMIVGLQKNNLTFLACKVLPGRCNIQTKLTRTEYTNGVQIPNGFDSNRSDNGIEVVIREPRFILPSFIIQYSLQDVTHPGTFDWNTPLLGVLQVPNVRIKGLNTGGYV